MEGDVWGGRSSRSEVSLRGLWGPCFGSSLREGGSGGEGAKSNFNLSFLRVGT